MKAICWNCSELSAEKRDEIIAELESNWDEVAVRQDISKQTMLDAIKNPKKSSGYPTSIDDEEGEVSEIGQGKSKPIPGLQPDISANVLILTLKNFVFILDLAMLGYHGVRKGPVIVGQITAYLEQEGLNIKTTTEQTKLTDFVEASGKDTESGETLDNE